ncbi:MAG: hypothetical protein JSU63_21890 [Phycisphaerales bacterium]|nr:MAG: hypothetical protein JSU63_21890 [Phycisphaerales bacterium]
MDLLGNSVSDLAGVALGVSHVQPDTAVRWHRQGFKLFWRWKSRTGKVGRPKIALEIRTLIRRMSRENPSWGIPRVLSPFSCLTTRRNGRNAKRLRAFEFLGQYGISLQGEVNGEAKTSR